MGSQTLVTIEQFDQLSDGDDVRFELDEGELIEVPSPRPVHQYVKGRVFWALETFIQHNQLASLVFLELEFRLNESTVRRPDVAFFGAEQAAQLDWERPRRDGAPDLAIEVVSPSDTPIGMRRKVRQFLDAGATAVWLIVPEAREVEIYGRERVTLGPGDTLTEKVLLPGFSFPVAELFPPPR